MLRVALLALVGCGRVGFGATGGHADASASTDGDPAADASVIATDANLVFVTSTRQAPGLLGGLAGADAVCQDLADAALLPGTYRALLSSSAIDARDRLASARGWIRTDGRAFADDVASLFAGAVFYPIALDELARPIGLSNYFTATGSDAAGRLGTAACSDWTNTGVDTVVGLPFSGSSKWVSQGLLSCGNAQHLYCFGVDRATAVAPPLPAGRRAFLARNFTPGGGLTVADASCANAASAAGITGSFRALVAGVGTTAASRFIVGSWYRLDGVRFTADLATIDAPLRLDASGAYVTDEVWTGANSAFAAGTTQTTCNNWSATGGNGSTGRTENATSAAFDTGTQQSCSSAFSLYCLEV